MRRSAGSVFAICMAVFLHAAGVAWAQEEASNALSSLTPERAREVVAGKLPSKTDLSGSFVRFDALSTLTPEVAAVLAEVKKPLSFNGLTEISPETATALAKHPPNPQPGAAHLRLNGIKRLSPEAAEALAAHEGKVLLHALEHLDSIPLAQKLARDLGEIRLGLTELTPEIAAELCRHRGAHDPKQPVLRRFDGAASILRLDNIERLSPETAEALAAHEGLLVLNGLTSIDPQVAASLARRTGNSEHKRDGRNRTGTLVLNGLTSISTDAAVALAAFEGDLVLKGIRELSPEAAAALAKQKGRLYLTGLTTLSPEAHAALKSHPDVLLPTPLPGSPPRPTPAKAEAAKPVTPGWTSLFNGRDLAGWRGRPGMDPAKEAAGSPEERTRRQAEWNADMAQHWSVKDGVIVSDGHGVFLTTDRDYGDFELALEWMLPEPCADSGIYLRGYPQVQIWDPACERDFKHGCEKGSGGLWNNPADAPGKWPLVKADKPIGEWNAMRVSMRGDRVTVVLNGQVVVDDALLANHFAKGQPLPARGPIQIQTHGAPMRVRNVFVRDLGTFDLSAPGWRDLGERDFTNVNTNPDTWAWTPHGVKCTGQPVGVIRSQQPITDFEMSLEWRHLSEGGNSGVLLWVPKAALDAIKPGQLPPGGIEVQMLDHGFTAQYEQSSGKKADWFTTHGDVFPVGSSKMTPFPPTAPDGKRSFPKEQHSRGTPEWNHYFIRAMRGEVRLWVNGHEVTGGWRCDPATGYLCLESEGTPVEFRRMKIREVSR